MKGARGGFLKFPTERLGAIPELCGLFAPRSSCFTCVCIGLALIDSKPACFCWSTWVSCSIPVRIGIGSH
jgi:hypothetical protein